MSQSRLLSIYINILELLAGNKCQEKFLRLFTAYLQFVISFVHGPLFCQQLDGFGMSGIPSPAMASRPALHKKELAALITYSLPFSINNLTF